MILPEKTVQAGESKKIVQQFDSGQLKKQKIGRDKRRIIEDGIEKLDRPPVPKRLKPGQNTYDQSK